MVAQRSLFFSVVLQMRSSWGVRHISPAQITPSLSPIAGRSAPGSETGGMKGVTAIDISKEEYAYIRGTLMMPVRFVYLLRFVLLVSCVYPAQVHDCIAQEPDYQGRLIDQASGAPIASAVVISSDSAVVTSNDRGLFTIPQADITISALGYYERSYTLIGEGVNEIQLIPNPIVLSGVIVQRLADNVDVQQYAGALSHLNAKSLARHDQAIIADALNSQSGIYMHTGALNTNRITVRGIGARSPFSTNKIRAYFGDIPLTDGVGETTIEDIDLSAVDHVTIFKGPNSSIYGAGLGGAIQLQPRRTPMGKHIYGEVGLGSYGLSRSNLGFAMKTADHELSVTYSRQTSDGYRQNNEFERNGVLLNTSWYLPKSSYTLMAYYVDQFAGIPSSVDEDDYLNAPQKAAFTWAAAQGYEDYNKLISGLTAVHEIGTQGELKTTVYTQWRAAYEPRPFNILEERVWGLGWRTRYQHELTGQTHFNVGFEAYQDQYDWKTYQNLYNTFPGQGSVQGDRLTQFSEARSFFNGFAELKHRLASDWSITAGMNINRTRYDLADLVNTGEDSQSGEYRFDWNVSPRIAVAYLPRAYTTIYGSISRGFSPPSLEETLTPEGTINPEIQPETGWSYELGTRGSLPNGHFGYELSLYAMQIDNLLVARRIAEDQYIGVNAGSTVHNGLELGINAVLWSGSVTRGQLQVNGSINDYRFEEFVDDENDYAGNDLTGVPSSQWSARLDLELPGRMYSRIEWLSVGEMPVTDANTVYAERYQLINAVLGWRPQVTKALVLDVRYRVNNLLNEKYASMLAVNAGSFGGSAPRYYYPGLPIFHQLSVHFRLDW